MSLNYEQLKDFYREYTIIDNPLDDNELIAYLMALEHRGNLIIEQDSAGDVIGLLEFWKINYEQLGRLIVNQALNAREEDTISGDIAWVANLLIHKDYQGKGIMELLRSTYFTLNFNCKYFCGNSQRKTRHKTVNIYKRTELISKYLKEGVSNGHIRG